MLFDNISVDGTKNQEAKITINNNKTNFIEFLVALQKCREEASNCQHQCKLNLNS